MSSALQQHDGQHQQRQRGRGRQFELGRILEQAPDLGGHGVKAGRQRQDRRRAEQRHGLQKRDQRARHQGRQRQRNRDAPRRHPGPPPRMAEASSSSPGMRSSALATSTNTYGKV